MKVAIMGAGIAGSWLYRRLNRSLKVDSVDIYDLPKAKLGCSCAFGTETAEFGYYMKAIGLDPEDYILQEIHTLVFQDNLLRCKTNNFCTIDRKKLIKDIVGNNVIRSSDRIDLDDPYPWDESEYDDYDYVIDATGHARAFLPSPMGPQLFIKTQQVREYRGLDAGWAAIRFKGIGYEWEFPLGNGEWHVGYGDIELDGRLTRRRKRKRVCSCTDRIRLSPPALCHPFAYGKVWGVGEAIGTVSPIVGEGIIPSLRCAEILYHNWMGRPNRHLYAHAVEKEFQWMMHEYQTIQHFLEGRRWRGIIGFLRDFSNGKRFGIKMRWRDIFKIFKVIRSWSQTITGGSEHGRGAGDGAEEE